MLLDYTTNDKIMGPYDLTVDKNKGKNWIFDFPPKNLCIYWPQWTNMTLSDLNEPEVTTNTHLSSKIKHNPNTALLKWKWEFYSIPLIWLLKLMHKYF